MLATTPHLVVVVFLLFFMVPVVFLFTIAIFHKRKQSRETHIKAEGSSVPSTSPEIGNSQPTQSQVIFVDLSPKSTDLVELAVEIWRIKNRIGKAGSDLQEIQKRGLESSAQKLQKYLDTFKIAIVDHTNQKYNEGMNVDVLSFEVDPKVTSPLIKETIEPTITCEGKVIRKGKVVVIKNI